METRKEIQLKVLDLISSVVCDYFTTVDWLCEQGHQKKIIDTDFIFNLVCKALCITGLNKECAAYTNKEQTWFFVGGALFEISPQIKVWDVSGIDQDYLSYTWKNSHIEIAMTRHQTPKGASRRMHKLYNKIEQTVLEPYSLTV